MATVQIKDRDGENISYTGAKVRLSNGDGTYTFFSEGIPQETKEIQITTNGTLEVLPDTGYDFFKKVGLTVNVTGSGNSVDFGLNTGDSLDTIYINTIHDTTSLNEVLVSLDYPYTSTMSGVSLKWNSIFKATMGSLTGTIYAGNLSAVQPDTYFIYYMDYTNNVPVPIYSTKEFDATSIIGSVITKGWSANKFSMGGQQFTLSYIADSIMEIKDNYFSKSPQIYGEPSEKGLKLTQTNTTYQSDESKEILKSIIEKAISDGTAQFSAPGWLIGLAFIVNNQVILSINSFYVVSGDSSTSFYIKGGMNTGSVEIDTKLSGTLNTSTNELNYNLDLLSVNGTDMTTYVTSTTEMRIVALK